MLQQTQVKTMTPYFERFVARFPTVESLAAASQSEVLAHWSGLGYYARARNLHAAAQTVTKLGSWPSRRTDWEQLPGVGRSTAAAIVSIVWAQREAILDGNVRRVLARQVCAEEPWGSAALSARLWPEAEARLPEDEAQMPRYTQALMDLGALVCLPKNPDCQRCPVRQTCAASLGNRQMDFPVPSVRRIRPERTEHWGLAVQDGKVFLHTRPSLGLWGGLWCLPRLDEPPSEQGGMPWGHLRHAFTHFELYAQIWSVPPTQMSQSGSPEQPGFWVALEDALAGPLPKPVRTVLERVRGD